MAYLLDEMRFLRFYKKLIFFIMTELSEKLEACGIANIMN